MDLFSAILSATKQIAHDTPDSNQNKVINRYKGLVNTQIKILWLFIHTRIVPNMYERIQIVILGRMTAAVTIRFNVWKKGPMRVNDDWDIRPNIVPNILLHIKSHSGLENMRVSKWRQKFGFCELLL